MKKIGYYLLSVFLLANAQGVFANNLQAKLAVNNSAIAVEQKNKRGDEGLINISLEGQQAAGIKTEILQVKSLPIYLSVPGEVVPNRDLTAIVTPRIQSQVVKRLAKVGDFVEQGQPLVQLSSVAMSEAQSELMTAYQEWLRAKKIKQQAIAAKYYFTAGITYQQKYSRLLSYGMTKLQIHEFLKSNDPSKANGIFTLLAPRKGTIFSADFTEGQMIEPGKILYKIVNETSLWVNGKLSSGESSKIQRGAEAIIQTAHTELPAEVLQIHHKLEKATRTRIVRLSVRNVKDQLHPGEFVTCLIKKGETAPVLAVNKTAIMRTPDGDMTVYIEVKPNYFQAKEVQIIKKVGSWRVIKGVSPGVRIVTKGAFFVHAEFTKAGFSTHNH